MAGGSAASRAGSLATVCAVTLIAVQVGGKATRDAMFLSTFDISALPAMMMVAALIAVAMIPVSARTLAALGPRRLVPQAFAASGVLFVAEWSIASSFPRAAAIALYIHIGSLGSVLISWFWSLINEQFDPRTARTVVPRIAAGATVGGLVGGLLAARLAPFVGVRGMLPVLAGLHVVGATLTSVLYGSQRPAAPHARSVVAGATPRAAGKPGLSLLWRSTYIRDLALLMAVCAIGGTVLDFAFKTAATLRYASGTSLLRFFGIFYTATGVATLLVQAIVVRRLLERFGLAPTAASLPVTLGVGGAAALLVPGLGWLAIARGAEAAVRSSLFRSGYELFFTPIPPDEKRAVKTMIDVGGERLGDLAGGGIVKLILVAVPAAAVSVLLSLAVVLGIVGLLVARKLHRGYTRALERSLLDRAVELEIGHSLDHTTREVIARTRPDLSSADLALSRRLPAAPPPPAPPPELDPVILRAAALRSGDPDRVRAALDEALLTPELVPMVIPLLAWDEVASRAVSALSAVASGFVGQLGDALLDPGTEFAIRRRIPRALSAVDSPRAVDALLVGLEDPRFEVRYQCGRALAAIRDRVPERPFHEEPVHAAAAREVAVERKVWEGHRLLDRGEDAADSAFVDRYLRRRANRSLEHVFTLLSLTLPKRPLIVAFRALHTSDETLRGTALEYLEAVLPEAVRVGLWSFLEDRRGARPAPRPRAEILAELMRANASVEDNLRGEPLEPAEGPAT